MKKHKKYDKMLEMFIKHNPKYTLTELCYDVVEKGRRYLQPAHNYAMEGRSLPYYVNEDVTPSKSPHIYGPALLVIHHETDELVAVFAL